MVILDTSVLVSFLTHEESTDAVQDWIAATTDALAITEWALTEFASAIALKRRAGFTSIEGADIALSHFGEMVDTYLYVVPVRRWHFESAAQLCALSRSRLRAADALHLAVALETMADVATLDLDMRDAARRMKLRTISFGGSGER
jgi:hypothetical protein